MSRKTILIIRVVLYGLWVLLAAVTWVCMLVMFVSGVDFEKWMMWGFASMLFMIPTALKFLAAGAVSGYHEDRRHGVAEIFYDPYTNSARATFTRNSGFFGAALSIVIWGFIFILAGPVLIVPKFIKYLMATIEFVRELRSIG
ncbi:MAG: hypothetical protein IJY04_10450 [Clostridia bacterium]|nr:hypothetical protein [Clostridia bacterium]